MLDFKLGVRSRRALRLELPTCVHREIFPEDETVPAGDLLNAHVCQPVVSAVGLMMWRQLVQIGFNAYTRDFHD